MIVYVYYEDTDSSCGDPECCGGPSPSPHIKIFSSLEKVKEAGHKENDVKAIKVDSNELADFF